MKTATSSPIVYAALSVFAALALLIAVVRYGDPRSATEDVQVAGDEVVASQLQQTSASESR
jgi:hypothetical protein